MFENIIKSLILLKQDALIFFCSTNLKMEFRCGGLFFTSKFDSGNLARVEKAREDADGEGGKTTSPVHVHDPLHLRKRS